MSTPFDLTNRVILVTGARGLLGRPICAALAEAGARVVGVDLEMGESTVYRADIRSVQELEGVLSGIDDFYHFGVPDGLVLLHGLDAKPGQNAADPWRDWQAILDVNLTGTANACRVFGGAMAEAGRGSVVTVGSLYAGLAPDQRMYQNCQVKKCSLTHPVTFTKPAAYSAGKAGVVGLTRYLAALWASSGVRVNCLSPGGIGSDATPEAFRSRFSERVPLGRMGVPGDLVGAVQWLLSDASAYVTGQEIRVDGGVGIWP